MGCYHGHHTLRLGVVGTTQALGELEQGNGILLVADGQQCIRSLDLILQTMRALMKTDGVGMSRVFLILVELCGGLLVFLFPEVCFNFQDRKEWPVGVVWVWLRSRDRRDGNGDRGHCPDCFRYLVTVDQLEMVRNVLEGAMEVGRVAWAGIIKNVVKIPCVFPLNFLGNVFMVLVHQLQ